MARLLSLLLILLVLSGCAASHHRQPGPARGVIDLISGAYGGVYLGEGDGAVIASLGQPQPDGAPPYLTPNNQPPSLPSDSGRQIVYPDLSVISRNGRVVAITVYGIGARTLGGLRIGQHFDRARRAVTRPVCQPAHGGQQPRDPNCQFRPRRGLYVYFSGDPVAVITISSEPVLAA